MKLIFLISLVYILISITKSQNSCSSSPCRPPSECENYLNDYVCHCKPGIKGQKCDRPLLAGDSLCLSSPCWNGGVCESLGTDFRCNCKPGFSGKDCKTILSQPCVTNNPCQNGANCQPVDKDGVLQAVCFCVGDWTGKYCESPIPLCQKPNPCFNGGICTDNTCNCKPNFSGTQCETFTPQSTDKLVKVLNKGFLIANLKLTYEQQVGLDKEQVVKTGTILLGQTKTFNIPNTVNYDGDTGAYLRIDVPLSFRQISIKLNSNYECFHVWGIFFAPSWARVNC